jgi:hypothetical protein
LNPSRPFAPSLRALRLKKLRICGKTLRNFVPYFEKLRVPKLTTENRQPKTNNQKTIGHSNKVKRLTTFSMILCGKNL